MGCLGGLVTVVSSLGTLGCHGSGRPGRGSAASWPAALPSRLSEATPPRWPMTRAGLPATTEFSATSRVTTLPAPNHATAANVGHDDGGIADPGGPFVIR